MEVLASVNSLIVLRNVSPRTISSYSNTYLPYNLLPALLPVTQLKHVTNTDTMFTQVFF